MICPAAPVSRSSVQNAPFFRSLRPAVFRRPRPLFRPTFPPAARSASACDLISTTRGTALPHISLYISIPCIYHLYRVLPSALLLFDHAAIKYCPPRTFPRRPHSLFSPPGYSSATRELLYVFDPVFASPVLRLFDRDHAAIISGSECIYRCSRMLFSPCEDVALPRAIIFALPRAVSC